jgi:hypothetical protein
MIVSMKKIEEERQNLIKLTRAADKKKVVRDSKSLL